MTTPIKIEHVPCACDRCRRRRKRNPYRMVEKAARVVGGVLLTALLLGLLVGYVWLLVHSIRVGAFEEIEVVKPVTEVRDSGLVAASYLGAIVFTAAGFGTWFWVAWLCKKFAELARQRDTETDS